MATDTFCCSQKIKTIPRPRCCVLYGNINDRKVTDTRMLITLNQKQIPPVRFGNIYLIRNKGPPGDYEVVKSVRPVEEAGEN